MDSGDEPILASLYPRRRLASLNSLKQRWIVFLLATIFLTGAAVIWSANASGLIPGSWGAVFFVFFTLLGVLLALYMALFGRRG